VCAAMSVFDGSDLGEKWLSWEPQIVQFRRAGCERLGDFDGSCGMRRRSGRWANGWRG
jgi:hypothetical protein